MTPEEVRPVGPPPASLRAAVISPGARRWYLGGLVGLIWLVNEGFDAVGRVDNAVDRFAIIAFLALYSLLYLAVPPVAWGMRQPLRLLPPAILWLASFALFPWFGWGVASVWVYVGVAAAMCMPAFRAMLGFVAVLTIAVLAAIYADGARGENLFYLPAITASVSLMMAAFGRTITSMNQLRATQHELARLAVDRERERVARDMHDILGHSLTVITVKAELAGRLVASDPAAASREIAEVEDLARGALADVRSTVSGYRGVAVGSEIASARAALGSAGIDADLPGSVDIVPADLRELFGWVVREGVTNVLRHSRARHCAVALTATSVEVTDDGRGVGSDEDRPGVGLAGLRERVEAAGLTLTAGPLPGGGFRLRVSA